MEPSWKRYFTPANTGSSKPTGSKYTHSTTGMSGNYSSYLPEVYTGSDNRIERYSQYETMDQDSHIGASLDIIAEFCTQIDDDTGLAFEVDYREDPTESETLVINKYLKKWIMENRFDQRLFDIVRGVIKYGDQFFIRDPETLRWLPVYHANVEGILVNEGKGKALEVFKIKDLDFNAPGLMATEVPGAYQGSTFPSIPNAAYSNINYNNKLITAGGKNRFDKGINTAHVLAEHVIHISMNNGQDVNWPFGSSILERVFKVFKQKELLEDSILIYRIQRAPERRVFYVDVGDLPEQKAMQFVERMKNEIHQKRIPSKTGGGTSVMDSTYSALSVLEDFFIPTRPDGRGSKIEVLPGGDTSWGIDELLYFDNKLARGLGVPSSYIPTGPDDSAGVYNDGKLGTAMLQELRFAKYCTRIQNTIISSFDTDFKLYLKRRGANISADVFDLKFVAPQDFGTWRKIEIDQANIQNFTNISNVPYISKRKALMKYLGWSEAEVLENIKMYAEENPKKFKDSKLNKLMNDNGGSDLGLGDVGISQHDLSPAPELDLGDENAEQPEEAPAENTPAPEANPQTPPQQ